MPSKLDRYLSLIESWFATEPQLTALTIVGRLAERDPEHFGPKQHSIVQRLLKKLRMKAAQQLHATPAEPGRGRGQIEETTAPSGPVDGSGLIAGPDPPTGP